MDVFSREEEIPMNLNDARANLQVSFVVVVCFWFLFGGGGVFYFIFYFDSHPIAIKISKDFNINIDLIF